MIPFPSAREKFLRHLQTVSMVTKGYVSPNTQRTYRRILERVEAHLRGSGFSDLSGVHLDDCHGSLNNHPLWSLKNHPPL